MEMRVCLKFYLYEVPSDVIQVVLAGDSHAYRL